MHGVYLVRFKSYTIINLIGLSLSLACCIILLRYINSELSVDDNCVDKDSVYGVKFVLDIDRFMGAYAYGVYPYRYRIGC